MDAHLSDLLFAIVFVTFGKNHLSLINLALVQRNAEYMLSLLHAVCTSIALVQSMYKVDLSMCICT